jgi:drug/metabolite transporter (DMT)-like permease
VSGVLFIILMQDTKEADSHFIGMLILMGAVLSAAVYNVSSRMNSVQFTPLEITFVMIWVGAVFFNIIGTGEAIRQGISFREYIHVLTDFHAYTAVLYLSILASVVAFFLYNYSLAKIQASQAAIFVNLITVISVTAGVLILKEAFYWYQAVGGIVIILGVWGTNYFTKSPNQKSKVRIKKGIQATQNET